MDSTKEAIFYKTISAYKQMRGWNYGICSIKDRAKTEFLLKKKPEGDLFNFKPFLEGRSEEIIRKY